ncbi:MAG TPA: hypothetical protein VLM40_18015 [Gemmata sp.]|nr:hypothetical protein [Gemmata sp.]
MAGAHRNLRRHFETIARTGVSRYRKRLPRATFGQERQRLENNLPRAIAVADEPARSGKLTTSPPARVASAGMIGSAE